MLVGVCWGYRPTVWHNYNIQTGVIPYMHIANIVFSLFGHKYSSFRDTFFLVLSVLVIRDGERRREVITLWKLPFFFFFFLRKGKEKCSRDLQEIVFHYRRLGDEREVFHPLGQTMFFFSVICQCIRTRP